MRGSFGLKVKKYNNTKVTVDGIKFDSKKEAARYGELKLLQVAGEISNLTPHPKFVLQPSFKKNGKTIRSITYTADFSYLKGDQVIIEDVKPYNMKLQKYILAEDFVLKQKMFEYLHQELTITLV